MIELAAELAELQPRISVIGVGGAGGNAVASMIRSGVRGVDFVAANTDAQSLRASPAEHILQLGRKTTQGLGAGSSAELGRAAAEESLKEIERMLDGAHMCFIAAGLGGGTGTGAAPVIAKAARARGILTVGVVTRPFSFEGRRRARSADAGLEALEREVDTLIVIPNQNLFRVASPDTTFKEAFDLADQVLQQGVRGITDLMVMPGLINLDFADLRTIMADMGRAMMGTGEAAGEGRALKAAEAAIANPLLDEPVKGARGLIISITGGEDLGLMEVDEAACRIKALVDPEADIIWGSAFDAAMTGRMRVSIVATGVDRPAAPPAARLVAPVPVAVPKLVEVETETAPVQAELPLKVLLACAPPEAASPTQEEEELLLTDGYDSSPSLLGEGDQAQHGGGVTGASFAPLSGPPVDALAPDYDEPVRGPSLFERMADAARMAVTRSRADPELVAAE